MHPVVTDTIAIPDLRAHAPCDWQAHDAAAMKVRFEYGRMHISISEDRIERGIAHPVTECGLRLRTPRRGQSERLNCEHLGLHLVELDLQENS